MPKLEKRVILTEHEYSCENMAIGEEIDTGFLKEWVEISTFIWLWSFLNFKSHKKFVIDKIANPLSKGGLIASSWMGITVFDLFNEIIAEDDMHKFLKDKGPKGIAEKDYNGAALVLRCFLLLVDLSNGIKQTTVKEIEHPHVEIKEEIVEIDFNEPQSNEIAIIDTNLYDEESGSSDEETFTSTRPKKTKPKSKPESNVCRGKGNDFENWKFYATAEVGIIWFKLS